MSHLCYSPFLDKRLNYRPARSSLASSAVTAYSTLEGRGSAILAALWSHATDVDEGKQMVFIDWGWGDFCYRQAWD